MEHEGGQWLTVDGYEIEHDFADESMSRSPDSPEADHGIDGGKDGSTKSASCLLFIAVVLPPLPS
jgi:hypothetical protein